MTEYPQGPQPNTVRFELNFDVSKLRTLALGLEVALPPPSAQEYLVLTASEPKPSLLKEPLVAPIKTCPEAFFALCPDLHQSELDEDYLEYHLHWLRKLSSGQTFEKVYAEVLTHHAEDRDTFGNIVTDSPAVAGLLLYVLSLPAPNTYRHLLLEKARQSAVGAYFAAEGLTLPDERRGIVDSVSRDTRMLYWTSRIPLFQDLCLVKASSSLDLYSGLMLVLSHHPDQAIKDWCERVSAKAFDCPVAATAALILLPAAPTSVRRRWLWTLREAEQAEFAYLVGRFAPIGATAALWEGLRALGTKDRGRFWFHWFRDIETEAAQRALDTHLDVDWMWAAELLHVLNLDDRVFRDRMRQLSAGNYFYNSAASLLRFIDHRRRNQSGK